VTHVPTPKPHYNVPLRAARVDVVRVEAGWLRDKMVVEGFSASERAADGGETLVEVDLVTVSRGLWDVVRGADASVRLCARTIMCSA